MSSPDRLLIDAMMFALDGHPQPAQAAVARQEAEGQAAMVEGVLLPSEIHRGTVADLEAMGVVFGEKEDDLFVRVQLPAGWRIASTPHAMHSDLLDEQGRRRAGIFYKAAFYDRKADLSLIPRFALESWQPCDSEGTPHEQGTYRQVVVCQDGRPVHDVGHYERLDWKTEDALRKTGESWLDTHWPDWRQVTAYWDASALS